MTAEVHSPRRRRYRNPPVAEAIARLHWSAGRPWKMTTPGQLYDAVKDLYPSEPEVRSIMEAQLQSPQGTPGSLELRSGPQQLVFSVEGGGRLLMVGPNDISVHGLPPYEGWESLEKRLFDAFERVESILLPHDKTVSSVGLRYINRIDLPSPTVDFADWLTISFTLPASFPQQMVAFLDRVEVVYPDEPVKLSFTWASAESSSPDVSSFVLDFDLTTTEDAVGSVPEARHLIASLKAKETDAFEGLLLDSLRERFDELG